MVAGVRSSLSYHFILRTAVHKKKQNRSVFDHKVLYKRSMRKVCKRFMHRYLNLDIAGCDNMYNVCLDV